jgi:hypothetical protein
VSAVAARRATPEDLLSHEADVQRAHDRGVRRLKSIKATDLPGPSTSHVQDRAGEETAGLHLTAIIRAVITYPGFWAAAALLPDNDIHTPRKWGHRAIHYPSWLLFLLFMIAGSAGGDSLYGACTYLRDPENWKRLAETVDPYVPAGWTSIAEIPPRSKRAQRRIHDEANGKRPRRVTECLPTEGPDPHHVDWFLARWRAQPRTDELGNTYPHPWAGVRKRVYGVLRSAAADLARELNFLNANTPLTFKAPDARLFARLDGTVFTFAHCGAVKDPAKYGMDTWYIGGEAHPKVGSKFTIASIRGDDPHTRVFLDAVHTGPGEDSEGAHEAESIKIILRRLKAEFGDGLRGAITDSILRGADVVDMQREGMIVVNWPHAATKGRKKNRGDDDTRIEKSHLLTTVVHDDAHGDQCFHHVWAVGGDILYLDEQGDGTLTPRPVFNRRYYHRGEPPTYREYMEFSLTCGDDELRTSTSLFHTDGTTSDPDFARGEYVRVFAPKSEDGKRLYGERNDTESGNRDTKRRIQQQLLHVPDQGLRVWATLTSYNAQTRAREMQRRGLPNVIDLTLPAPSQRPDPPPTG